MRSPPRQTDRPLYRQIADKLRALVAGMASGERIASEPELARQFAVSRFTIAHALQELVDDGLITRRQGLGSFVASPPLKRTPGELLSFTEAVRASGHEIANQLLAFGPTPWRSGLPYGGAEALIVFERLRFVDGAPAAIHRSVLSARTAEQIGLDRARASERDVSLYALFEAAGLGVESGVERLMARPPSSEERARLKLGEDGVVIAVQRVSFALDGRALDFVEATYDARRYGYESRVTRPRADATTKLTGRSGDNGDGQDNFETRFGGVTALGPRLGPWSGGRRRSR